MEDFHSLNWILNAAGSDLNEVHHRMIHPEGDTTLNDYASGREGSGMWIDGPLLPIGGELTETLGSPSNEPDFANLHKLQSA